MYVLCMIILCLPEILLQQMGNDESLCLGTNL